LTGHFDENAYPLGWGPDGIYLLAQQKTNSHVFRINPQSRTIRRITSPDVLHLQGVSFATDFTTLAFVADDATHMGELYTSDVSSFSPRKLTDMTAQVEDWNLGTGTSIAKTRRTDALNKLRLFGSGSVSRNVV